MLNYTLNAKIQVKLMIGLRKNQTEFSAKNTAIFRTFTTLLKKGGKFAKLILIRCKKDRM
tara:strand:- start:1822 stop:2001 length:180 start_codon:yes stop_codon:yes gene_type:complete